MKILKTERCCRIQRWQLLVAVCQQTAHPTGARLGGFLSLFSQLPARLNAEQAGWVLNCQPHDIPALINARLLKPLGNPSQNSTKYFSTMDVLELTKDRAWLVKVTNTISQHWQKQNARKKSHSADLPPNGLS